LHVFFERVLLDTCQRNRSRIVRIGRIPGCSIPSALWLGGSPRLRALRRSGGVHQLRSNHHLHRHPKLHRTTLCV